MRVFALASSLLTLLCACEGSTTEAEEAPPVAAPEPPEDALARRLAAVAGPIDEVEELRFTFVVTVGGEEQVRRGHVWCPAASSASVSADGTSTIVATNAEPSEAQREAYEQFVNDSYWLLVPTKLFDSGVHRAMEGDDLRLTFVDVGVTPGDTYWLEPDGDHVAGWRFRLESGREGSFAFEDRTEVGPLTLALTKRARDGDAVITFEAVSVQDVCSLGT